MDASPTVPSQIAAPTTARGVTELHIPFGGPLRMLEIEPRQARWDVAVVLVAPIGLLYLPSLIQWLAVAGARDAEIELEQTGLALGKLLEMLLAIGVAAYFVCRNGVRLPSIGIHSGDWGRQLLWSIAAFVSSYGYLLTTAMIILPLLFYFYGSDGLSRGMPEKQRLMESFEGIRMPWLIVTLIAVAIHEEILFRGLLLTLLRRASGSWWIGILGSSLVFGSLHFSQGWLGIVQVTGLGIVLSVIFVASRSLPAVMIAHFLFNFCQIQLMQLFAPWLKHLT